MRTVRDIPNLQNVPVLVRAALNVPIADEEVASDYRLRRALASVRYLTERGAKVILAGHLTGQGTETLAPVARALEELLPRVAFCPEPVGKSAREAARALLPGSVLVLENLRRDTREQANDPSFAQELAALADVFVQDSFDTCHRRHASIVGVPTLLPSYAGLLLEEEVRELSRALAPKKPALAIIGGAKFQTKEPVIRKFVETYDAVYVGGALANDFLKAAGFEVGKSLVSGISPEEFKELVAHKSLSLPVDVIAKSSVDDSARTTPVSEVRPDEIIVDIGPETVALLAERAAKAKMILWNGPFGNYENGFVDATQAIARTVARAGESQVGETGDPAR